MTSSTPDLFQQLLDLRDRQRKQRESGLTVIRGKDLKWEDNALGQVRWYMHPLLDDRAINSLIVYEHKLAPGARGARLRYQGGMMVFVVEGRGHTVIDGEVFPWEKDAVIQLPLRPDGITYQHVNDDPEKPARLLCAEPNTTDSLTVDRGSGFEVLERSSKT